MKTKFITEINSFVSCRELRFLSGTAFPIGNFVSGSVASDYVFKQVFGKQENERILISFLNAMLNGDYNIKSAKVITPRYQDLRKQQELYY